MIEIINGELFFKHENKVMIAYIAFMFYLDYYVGIKYVGIGLALIWYGAWRITRRQLEGERLRLARKL